MDPFATSASIVTVAGGIASLVAWRRRRKPATASAPQAEAFELLPNGFMIDLLHSPPSVQVDFYAINYLDKQLTLIDLKAALFPNVGAALPHIQAAREFMLPVRRAVIISCRRSIADTEARSFQVPLTPMPVSGSVEIIARAAVGRRTYVLAPTHRLAVAGGIQQPAG